MSETSSAVQTNQQPKNVYRGKASEAVYGLGMIGAWVYYITHATTIWMAVLGILKGIFWPAILVYQTLMMLGM